MTLTFGQVIGHLTAGIRKPDGTVDRLEPGAPESEVQGIVTAFSASQYVIEQAVLLGANLIITHEGVFIAIRTTGKDWRMILYTGRNLH